MYRLQGKVPGKRAKERIISFLEDKGATMSNKRFCPLTELAAISPSVYLYYKKLVEDGTLYCAGARIANGSGFRGYISYNNLGLPPQFPLQTTELRDYTLPEIGKDGNILQNSRMPFSLGP